MKHQIKKTLSEISIRPQKSRGQNFLNNKNIARDIVEFANVESEVKILEIGPGLGVLTEILVQRTKRLFVVEIEEEFCLRLREQIPSLPSEQIIQGDIRQFVASTLCAATDCANALAEREKIQVISNVPYSISTDIVLWLLKNRLVVSSATFLLQREFAQRLAAEPGGRTYGALTVLRTVYCTAELGFVVSGSEFVPQTKVQSRLIKLIPRKEPLIPADKEEHLTKVVRACFLSRRKTILNSLTTSGIFGAKEQVQQALKNCSILPTRRAETLSVEEFYSLVQAVSEQNR